MPRRRKSNTCQAWVEAIADDPEAISAFAVARDRLASARHLTGLRRLRVLELSGPLPDAEEQAQLLHRSIQFYNPHKERCTLRSDPEQPPPLRPGEHAVLVTERGGERRAAAERWWLHETGLAIEVREGTAWALSFEDAAAAAECVVELTVVKDRAHGLLCNPQAQEARYAGAQVPIPWMKKAGRAKNGGASP